MLLEQLDWWIIPIAVLVLIAVLQILYIIGLLVTTGRGRRAARQPSGPIMPTAAPNNLNTNPYPTQPPRASNGKMVVISGLPGQTEISLPGAQFAIGRFYDPDKTVLVALDERSISRRHAVFSSNELLREYYLTDTGSSYGTAIQKENRLDALKAGQAERIYNDDVVQFGNTIRVRFVLPTDRRAASGR